MSLTIEEGFQELFADYDLRAEAPATSTQPPSKVLHFPYHLCREPTQEKNENPGEVVSFPVDQPANYYGWRRQEREFARIRRMIARELMA